jgi:hypothetical protein
MLHSKYSTIAPSIFLDFTLANYATLRIFFYDRLFNATMAGAATSMPSKFDNAYVMMASYTPAELTNTSH